MEQRFGLKAIVAHPRQITARNSASARAPHSASAVAHHGGEGKGRLAVSCPQGSQGLHVAVRLRCFERQQSALRAKALELGWRWKVIVGVSHCKTQPTSNLSRAKTCHMGRVASGHHFATAHELQLYGAVCQYADSCLVSTGGVAVSHFRTRPLLTFHASREPCPPQASSVGACHPSPHHDFRHALGFACSRANTVPVVCGVLFLGRALPCCAMPTVAASARSARSGPKKGVRTAEVPRAMRARCQDATRASRGGKPCART